MELVIRSLIILHARFALERCLDVLLVPARLFLVKPLVLGISSRQHIQVLILIDARVIKLLVITADESITEKLLPQLESVLFVRSILIPWLATLESLSGKAHWCRVKGISLCSLWSNAGYLSLSPH